MKFPVPQIKIPCAEIIFPCARVIFRNFEEIGEKIFVSQSVILYFVNFLCNFAAEQGKKDD